MAESPSRDSTSENSDPIVADPVQQQQHQQYWCYHCDKRVSVETVPDIVCFDCKNGFVEAIAFTSNHSSRSTPPAIGSPSDFVDDEASFGSQFLQVLRLIAQASREEDAAAAADADAPPPPPPDVAHLEGDDFLRIELDGWDDNVEDGEDVFGDAVEVEHEEEDADEDQDQDEHEEDEEEERSDDEEIDQNLNNNNEETDEDEDEEDQRRRRRDAMRLRIRDIAARARTGRNRFLDWADLLMGLEDNSIELRLEMPQHDGYVGNPEDYVDAAGYEALLQNLADSDQNGRRGPPPAAKSAISALPDWTISSKDECMQCAICKDVANIDDTVKKLPCGHGYHGDCIIPWLGSRNSCPVCRFELPTDDHEYESEKQKKVAIANNDASEASGSG